MKIQLSDIYKSVHKTNGNRKYITGGICIR